MTGRDSKLGAALETHVREVDERVLTGPYVAESEEIRRAVDALPGVLRHLGLREFVSSLGTGSGKPQLLLHFRDETHGEVVLKVYGRRRPNEAAIQGRWAAAGAGAVPVLAAGDEPVSWLLMPRVDGDSPGAEAGPGLTPELAGVMRVAHAVDAKGIGEPRDLEQGVGGHLRGVLSVAARHGYRLPENWSGASRDAYAAGPGTRLHGDLTVLNLLRIGAGPILLLDTCGYTGPPEFDAARWCARTGGVTGADELMRVWLSAEPGLDAVLADRLLGLELLMEAGVREIVKEEQHRETAYPDRVTRALIDLGAAKLT